VLLTIRAQFGVEEIPLSKPSTVFIRTASGLVREYGVLEAFLMGTFITWGLLWTVMQFPWFFGFFPGSNLPLALLIVLPLFVVYGIVYWALGVTMPRAGADYMWVSRTFGPFLGFSWSMLWFVAFFYLTIVYPLLAFESLIATSFSIQGLLFDMSSLTNIGAFLLTTNGTFAFVALMVVFYALVTIFGGNLLKRLFYLAIITEVIGIAIMWMLLGSSTPATFAQAWDASSLGKTLPYDQVISTATSNGFKIAEESSWAMTMSSLPLASLFLFGFNWQTIAAGEFKNFRKSVPISIFGVLLVTFIFWTVTATLNLRAFGNQWFYALAYLWEIMPSAYPLPTPTMNLMLSILAYPNQLLISLIAITFIVTSFPMAYITFFLATRYIFAWSFDRLIPTKFAEVNRRTRTPVYATILLAVITLLMMILYLYTSFGTLYTMATFAVVVSYLGPSIAAIVFPYVQKSMFEGLPSFLRRRIAGIPIVTIAGVVCTITFGYLTYVYYVTPQITTPGLIGTALIVASFLLGSVIYVASRLYWRGRGVAVEMAFKELPPD